MTTLLVGQRFLIAGVAFKRELAVNAVIAEQLPYPR
jgi:hypothetical protein